MNKNTKNFSFFKIKNFNFRIFTLGILYIGILGAKIVNNNKCLQAKML